jgi:hypothetical protein
MPKIDIILLKANYRNHPEVVRKAYERLVEAKVEEKYTIRQEISIIRQRDRKPEEFAVYDAYVEQCKKDLKQQIGMEDSV